MADVDSNLVKAIAEQVMAALRLAAGSGVNGPADIHAPIGQCTGDYSKFPELKQLQSAPAPAPALAHSASSFSAAAPSAVSTIPPAVSAAPAVTALKGVITVSQLRTIRGAIRLAKGAILTPLASDFIRDHAFGT